MKIYQDLQKVKCSAVRGCATPIYALMIVESCADKAIDIQRGISEQKAGRKKGREVYVALYVSDRDIMEEGGGCVDCRISA